MKESKYYKAYRKQKLFYDVLCKWMYCDIYDRSIVDTLAKNDIHSVSIYGAGDLGSILYHKLKDSKIHVDCFIDKYSIYKWYGMEDIRIIKPGEVNDRRRVDLIINTAIFENRSVIADLKENNINIPVVSLEDIIMQM